MPQIVQVMSSREFNQDVSRAKRAARDGPVFVTDRGRPTHVLLGIEAYRRLSGESQSVIDLLALPDSLDPPSTADPDWPATERRRAG